MKPLNILGVILIFVGVSILIGFGLYKLFESTEIPIAIRCGIITVISGIIIVLISLIRERIKDKEL